MKYSRSAVSRQRGFVSGKVMFLCVVVAIGIMVKNNSSSSPSAKSGQSATSVLAELGQPVHKEQIPRPR